MRPRLEVKDSTANSRPAVSNAMPDGLPIAVRDVAVVAVGNELVEKSCCPSTISAAGPGAAVASNDLAG